MLSYFFRVLRLILIILTISYFIGTIWYVFCWQLYLDYYEGTTYPSFINSYMNGIGGYTTLLHTTDSFGK